MQRVVRLSFVGLLAIASASITACGDKVTVPPPAATDSVVHSVTVSPPSANMNVGDKVQFGASVDAGAGISDRTVKWSSSNSAVATVDQTGLVTAVAAGTASILATSNANTQVSGAAVVTVSAGTPAALSFSSFTQTQCDPFTGVCNTAAANLNNVANQLDVNVNLDAGTQKVTEVDLIMNCGGADTIVAKQTFASADVAPEVEASASVIDLPVNTAAFNATSGAPAFKNGACTLKTQAVVAGGKIVANASQGITLNNIDGVIVVTTNSGNTANDAVGAPWKSGNVTVAATPVLYSGRTAATVSITLPGANVAATQTVPASSTGTTSATWSASSSSGPNVKGLTLAGLADANGVRAVINPSVGLIDSQGNSITTLPQLNSISQSGIRIDNQAPDITTWPVVYTANTQNTSANWVGANFTFTKAITLNANTKADNSGVDVVTFTTQWSPTGAGTWTTFSDVKTLTETSTSTVYDLRVVVCDKLNNCSNSPVLTQFGVDLTAPTASTVSGPANNEIDGIGQAISATAVAVSATDPQGAGGVTGSGFGATPVVVSETRLWPKTIPGTDQQTTCVIGTQATDGTCSAPADSGLTFNIATTSPGQYALTYMVVDQAGNSSGSVALNYYLDQTNAPSMTGGISIPASITVGSAFTASGTDDMDFASVNARLTYPGLGADIMIPGTSSATGVAFDNTLTRASTATVTLNAQQFYRTLTGASGAAVVLAATKPSQIGIRGVDAANNLSTADVATFPATNISTPAGTPYTFGTDLADFEVAVSPASVSNGTGTGAKSTTITATVTAIDLAHSTPFTQVCFYTQNQSGAEGAQGDAVTGGVGGELVLIGCTSTNNVTQTTTTKTITYSITWDPSAKYGTSQTLPIFAVGVNATQDALFQGTPASLTLTN